MKQGHLFSLTIKSLLYPSAEYFENNIILMLWKYCA